MGYFEEDIGGVKALKSKHSLLITDTLHTCQKPYK